MSESFQLKIPETLQVNPETIVKIIAKTTSDTLHPGDKHSHRVFLEDELVQSARSLALKPVKMNHQQEIPGALVVNANYNKTDKVVEALLSLPQNIIDLIRAKEITNVSVEYIWDDVLKEGEKSVFQGLKFLAVSLLHGLAPGDPNAKVLLESTDGKEVMEIALDADYEAFMQYLGEPFADYKDFADCVAKNQDKDNPEAYCGYIKHQTEKEALAEMIRLKQALKRLDECLPK